MNTKKKKQCGIFSVLRKQNATVRSLNVGQSSLLSASIEGLGRSAKSSRRIEIYWQVKKKRPDLFTATDLFIDTKIAMHIILCDHNSWIGSFKLWHPIDSSSADDIILLSSLRLCPESLYLEVKTGKILTESDTHLKCLQLNVKCGHKFHCASRAQNQSILSSRSTWCTK